MATIDYAGYDFTMEAYTGQSTDGNGEVVITLQNAPVDANCIVVQINGNKKRIAEIKSLAGANATVVIRKMLYDRTDTAVASAVNLPASVTVATTIQNTDTYSPDANRADSGTAVNASPAHAHQVSFQYAHAHNYTATDLPLATSESSLTLTFAYAY
jgi:hypothetical protein